MRNWFLISVFATLFFGLVSLPASAVQLIQTNAYATTNVTTSAYVTLGNVPATAGTIVVCDNSGQLVKLAMGSVGNEVDQVTLPINACMYIDLTLNFNVGSRISLKAISASATTGFASVSYLP